jgi:hypothetical protein
METLIKTAGPEQARTTVALHELVNQVMISLLPCTARQKSLIVNDVHREMLVRTDKDVLASVLDCLLSNTIIHTKNNCIHISAKLFGSITLVHVKNNGSHYDDAIAYSLKQIEPMAKKLGGCVSITNNKLNGTTLAFSFNNNRLAARK